MISKRYFHQDRMVGPLSTADAVGTGFGLPQEPVPDLGRLWTGTIAGLESMTPENRKRAIDALGDELGRRGWGTNGLGISSPHYPPHDIGRIEGYQPAPAGDMTRKAEAVLHKVQDSRDPRDVNRALNEQAKKFWEANIADANRY